MELLLLSNSTLPGKAWLEHALPLIAEQLQGRRSAVFIPFAGVTQTWDDYTAKTAAVLAPLGVSVTGIHSVVDPVAAIENAEIVIVGGGNTFQLLKQCRERGLLAPITFVVKRGPLVYCLESMDIEGGHKIDNVLIPADIRLTPKKITIEGSPIVALDGTARLVDEVSWKDTLYREVGKADKPVHIRLIPYYAWGNRGKAEMTVWMPLARTNH